MLLCDYKDIDNKAVADSVKDALSNGFLDAVEAVVDELQLDGDAVVIDSQIWTVFFPKQ